MGIFDFFKKKKPAVPPTPPEDPAVDRSGWTGRDFEFMITGDLHIPDEDYDRIMTPNTLGWCKVHKDDWYYYQVAGDEYTYSWEMPGIQMIFNDEITYGKARQIADEVLENIRSTGQKAELLVLDSTKNYFF